MKRKIKFAPEEEFKTLLEWGVMPTFDLVIEYGNHGVIMVKRKLAPYKNQWALPGLRQYNGESFNDTLSRIAEKQLGLKINPNGALILGQYDGFFKTRQDISTGYFVSIDDIQDIKLNEEHFHQYTLVNSEREVPRNTGAMYKFYLKKYFELKK